MPIGSSLHVTRSAIPRTGPTSAGLPRSSHCASAQGIITGSRTQSQRPASRTVPSCRADSWDENLTCVKLLGSSLQPVSERPLSGT